MAAAVAPSTFALQVPIIQCNCRTAALRCWPSTGKTILGYTLTNLPPLYRKSSIISASKSSPNRNEVDSDTDDDSAIFQEDLNYVIKLGAGCVAGAAVIKYGSILLPEITRPNIYQALAMVLVPCAVAVVLLIQGSVSNDN